MFFCLIFSFLNSIVFILYHTTCQSSHCVPFLFGPELASFHREFWPRLQYICKNIVRKRPVFLFSALFSTSPPILLLFLEFGKLEFKRTTQLLIVWQTTPLVILGVGWFLCISRRQFIQLEHFIRVREERTTCDGAVIRNCLYTEIRFWKVILLSKFCFLFPPLSLVTSVSFCSFLFTFFSHCCFFRESEYTKLCSLSTLSERHC